MANNNYPQITSVTSESLQAQIRNLLPSQEGFGTDLMAQNVIVPVIDLTQAAEGSSVSQNLQTALSFGSQTTFSANGSTVVIANTAGFWFIEFHYSLLYSTGGNQGVFVDMSDGLSSKRIADLATLSSAAGQNISNGTFSKTVYLDSGESISAGASALAVLQGSSRQIADSNGNLINPSGFNPQ